MTPNKKRLIAIACALIGPAIMAGTWAAANKPAETKPSADTKAEARILAVLDDLHREKYSMWNLTPEAGRLLRILAETMGAKKVVEIGTSNGYSAIWFSLALRTTGGMLITHEIDDYRVSLARNNFKRAGIDHLVTIVEGDAHKTVTKLKGPIDILFLDADKSGNLDYLNKLLPLVRPGGLILAHNTTTQAEDVKDYIKAVTTSPDLETIFLHKNDRGLALTLKKGKPTSSQH